MFIFFFKHISNQYKIQSAAYEYKYLALSYKLMISLSL